MTQPQTVDQPQVVAHSPTAQAPTEPERKIEQETSMGAIKPAENVDIDVTTVLISLGLLLFVEFLSKRRGIITALITAIAVGTVGGAAAVLTDLAFGCTLTIHQFAKLFSAYLIFESIRAIARRRKAMNPPPLLDPSLPVTGTPASSLIGTENGKYNLGVHFHTSEVGTEDHAAAANPFQIAAEQGHAKAQFDLGNCYFRGVGLPRDNVLAYMWFNLSAASGNAAAAKAREIVAAQMTREEVAEAQRMSREWKPSAEHGDKASFEVEQSKIGEQGSQDIRSWVPRDWKPEDQTDNQLGVEFEHPLTEKH